MNKARRRKLVGNWRLSFETCALYRTQKKRPDENGNYVNFCIINQKENITETIFVLKSLLILEAVQPWVLKDSRNCYYSSWYFWKSYNNSLKCDVVEILIPAQSSDEIFPSYWRRKKYRLRFDKLSFAFRQKKLIGRWCYRLNSLRSRNNFDINQCILYDYRVNLDPSDNDNVDCHLDLSNNILGYISAHLTDPCDIFTQTQRNWFCIVRQASIRRTKGDKDLFGIKKFMFVKRGHCRHYHPLGGPQTLYCSTFFVHLRRYIIIKLIIFISVKMPMPKAWGGEKCHEKTCYNLLNPL